MRLKPCNSICKIQTPAVYSGLFAKKFNSSYPIFYDHHPGWPFKLVNLDHTQILSFIMVSWKILSWTKWVRGKKMLLIWQLWNQHQFFWQEMSLWSQCFFNNLLIIKEFEYSRQQLSGRETSTFFNFEMLIFYFFYLNVVLLSPFKNWMKLFNLQTLL